PRAHPEEQKLSRPPGRFIPQTGRTFEPQRGDLADKSSSRWDNAKPRQQQQPGDSDQDDSGEALSALAHRLTDPAPQAKTHLRNDESLNRDDDQRADDRHPGKTNREADRELIQADAEADADERRTAGRRKQRQSRLLLLFVGQQHVRTQGHERKNRDVIGEGSNDVSDRRPNRKSDQRHPTFKAREQKPQPQSLPRADARDS